MFTARERVKRVMRFEKADRIPRYDIFLGGFPDEFHKVPGRQDTPIYDYYDQVDIGTILADQSGPFIKEARPISREGNKKVDLDSWGRVLLTHTDGYFEQILESAVKERSDVDRLDFSFKPELHGPVDPERLRKVDERFCTVSGCMGIFNSAWRLRGEEDFLADMCGDPEFVDALVNRVENFLTPLGLHTARKTNTLDTAVWVYDEMTSRLGPMFSPKMFERYFMEPYKRMFRTWRENGITNIILHCDGNSTILLDMLIEVGFTGVQSMAPTAGMWLPDVRKKVGNKLVLIGGMDNIETLTHGTPAQIEKETRELIEVAKDGGVILGTHSIDYDVPVENYDLYDSLMRKYGGMES